MAKLKIRKVTVAGARTLPIFAELDSLAHRIRDRAYDLFTGRGFGEGHDLEDWLAAEKEFCWPTAELAEKDDAFALRVALVGFKRRDITVTAGPRELIVKATRKSKREKRASKRPAVIRWTEFHNHDVYRRVALPRAIDVKAVSARFANGLLKIEAPKAAAKTRAG